MASVAVPKEKRVGMTVSIYPSLKEDIELIAATENLSTSRLVENVLRDYRDSRTAESTEEVEPEHEEKKTGTDG